MRTGARISMIACAVLSTACGGASKSAPPPGALTTERTVENTDFDLMFGVDLPKYNKSKTGLYWIDIKPGTGVVAAEGRKAAITYMVSLPNGQMVEAMRQPIEMEIGPEMMRGLREGLPGMRVGGQRRLLIPPKLGYGAKKYSNLPPNSVIVFEFELVSVR